MEAHSKSVDIGQAVREFREKANLSVRALAAECGFSASFISQVENGQSSPSITSLERIATALGVSLVQLFQTLPPTPAIIRRTDRAGITSGWSRAKLQILSSGPNLEALLVVLAPGGASSNKPAPHACYQFALVLAGQVLLSLNEAEHQLECGDAVRIPAGAPRRWQNTSDAPAEVLLVSAVNSR